jgi:acylphosphatase
MEVKKRITIRGPRIFNVTYRLFLYEEASRLGLSLFDARNLVDRGIIEVLVGGDPESVREFIAYVKSQKPPQAEVEEVEEEDYVGHIKTIESFERGFMLSQQSKLANYGLIMLEKQEETISVIREESEKTREELGGIIREESQKTREELSGVIREESEKTREELGGIIREESQKTRGELTSKLDEGFTELKEEHIKTRKLSKEIFYAEVRELREEIRDLRTTVEEIRRKIEV